MTLATGWRRAALAAVVSAAAAFPAAGSDSGEAKQPRNREISYYHDALYQSVRPVSRVFDPAGWVRRIAVGKREALNVDANDQVRLPSTWWQPRIGHRPVSVEQMLRGPGPGTGPVGKWKVVGAKTEGVSPGFQIKDEQGNRFAVKFDPRGMLEMATGADVVVSKLIWAAGYNAPDNSILFFRAEDLEIDSDATSTDLLGRKKPLDREFLDAILAKVEKTPDSLYRAVASRFVPGKPIGEWLFENRRFDDPDDLVPHQHRREIRGLWPIAAWTNHTDCSARNTLDTWVTEGGRSFVRHWLIDFSGCLGSGSISKQSIQNGHEYLLDLAVGGANLATLGLRVPPWEHAVDPQIPAVGFIEARTFDADGWKTFLPNPAFDERTDRDVRWGARIVAAFTDEHIRAAVEAGRYSDPRAVEYLTQVLIDRRDKIRDAWLGGSAAAETGGR